MRPDTVSSCSTLTIDTRGTLALHVRRSNGPAIDFGAQAAYNSDIDSSHRRTIAAMICARTIARRRGNGLLPNDYAGTIVPTIEQSASQLFYCLIDGPVDLQPLRVLKSHAAAWARWNVRLHVLGASHAIEFRRDEECVTELLTCVRKAATCAPLLGLQSDIRSRGCASARGLCCHVELIPFSLMEGDALTASYADGHRLDVAFPYAGPGMAAVTRVGWREEGANLVVETVHSYPEEGRGVRSLSVFNDEEAER